MWEDLLVILLLRIVSELLMTPGQEKLENGSGQRWQASPSSHPCLAMFHSTWPWMWMRVSNFASHCTVGKRELCSIFWLELCCPKVNIRVGTCENGGGKTRQTKCFWYTGKWCVTGCAVKRSARIRLSSERGYTGMMFGVLSPKESSSTAQKAEINCFFNLIILSWQFFSLCSSASHINVDFRRVPCTPSYEIYSL